MMSLNPSCISWLKKVPLLKIHIITAKNATIKVMELPKIKVAKLVKVSKTDSIFRYIFFNIVYGFGGLVLIAIGIGY